MWDFQEIEFERGTIGYEIQRMMLTRRCGADGKADRESPAAIMLTSFVISFVHFVLGMIVFGSGFEESPDIADVWQVLNGNDTLKHMALIHSISDFLPVLLDTQTGDGINWNEAENITDIYNKWVTGKMQENK